MNTIIISPEALVSMIGDCYSKNDDNETGGILIGPKKHKKIITDIIPSTNQAERTFSSYFQSEKDVAVLNKQLREYQQKEYDYKGDYHKHPFGMNMLSSIDINTCLQTLKSENYKIDNFLIECIITNNSNQDIPFFCYTLSLDDNGRIQINQAAIKILPRNCILECMEFFKTGEMKNESINSEQHIRRIEFKEASNTLRNSGERENNNKLVEKEERIKENRKILSKGKRYFNKFTRRIHSCFSRRF